MKDLDKKENVEKIDRIRSRMFCNQLKQVLLGEAHNSLDDQARILVAHPASPILSEATFLSWWDGSRRIQRGKLQKSDAVVPLISRWFELEHIGSPMQRHMGALRTMCTEYGDGDWVKRKGKRIDDGVAASESIWSTLWSIDLCPSNGTLSMSWQLEQIGIFLGRPTLRYADDLNRVRAEAGLINGYAFEVTDAARAAYASQSDSGLFRFLLALLFEPKYNEQPWWPLLALDIGSAAAHCRARISVGAGDPYNVYGARDLNWVFIVSRALWSDDKGFVGSLLHSARAVGLEVGAKEFCKQLIELRETYRYMVSRCGVSQEEIALVARPEIDYVDEAKNKK